MLSHVKRTIERYISSARATLLNTLGQQVIVQLEKPKSGFPDKRSCERSWCQHEAWKQVKMFYESAILLLLGTMVITNTGRLGEIRRMSIQWNSH